ncbi:type III-A CRISPR-associated protein Csm2 [Eubacterium sp. 1001713B170207_170306_E7]|uniref:type III-A CRISPR-associated protein Csm2 n=1 Tax=Eubacterium sp. 1001713B170207_170306_E7 TaxID=2787097 RepID=UPI00189AE63C|nr:type III-A CRISPR-associated protein Csm2 [Eubacterium sp. 1001713B170207_170306_E7]
MSETAQKKSENSKKQNVAIGTSITLERLEKEQISVIAEAVIKDINDEKKEATANQIRNFLTDMVSIRNQLESNKTGQEEGKKTANSRSLVKDMMKKLDSLKMHLVYQAARNNGNLKNLMKKANLVYLIDTIIKKSAEDASSQNTTGKDIAKNFYLLANYVEALIAYHKYYESEKV